ncbi:nucleoside triphosphate pyrophosphohydrolase [Hellea balneolensis]|uniref:nucleoside triphosphate pyrophosphohydrolase n=1 Tax=Hellea balneolensis TaxID=287478 RepID=UPI0003F4E353|nr:nucleoside triphosphate pyrophosphohydrolase [Hellea balneolensis]
MTTDITFLGTTPIERLKTLMDKLRVGCPWDAEQTFETIAPYTIEEAYEVSEAIDRKDMVSLREELGDLLFQVIFQTKISSEVADFDFDDVCDDLTRKMVDRHPHVFEFTDDRTAQEQTVSWEDTKAAERDAKGHSSILDDVPLALPELMRAAKLQKRAARVGFDWPNLDGVIDKIIEESQEVADAAMSKDHDAIEDEIGDLLFAVTNLARKLDVDPELALRRTNSKFTMRFKFIETEAKAHQKNVNDMSLDEMETLWQAAKKV